MTCEKEKLEKSKSFFDFYLFVVHLPVRSIAKVNYFPGGHPKAPDIWCLWVDPLADDFWRRPFVRAFSNLKNINQLNLTIFKFQKFSNIKSRSAAFLEYTISRSFTEDRILVFYSLFFLRLEQKTRQVVWPERIRRFWRSSLRIRQDGRIEGHGGGSLVQSGTSCRLRRCGSSPVAGPARADLDASENNHYVFASLLIRKKYAFRLLRSGKKFF